MESLSFPPLSAFWQDSSSKKLAFFIIANGGFMLLQVIVGLFVSNFNLVAAGIHTGFDCLAFGASLVAMTIARRKNSYPFSYGFDRFEVLAGFTNSILVVFACVCTIFESFHRFYTPMEIHGSMHVHILLACIAMCVDIVGLFMFRKSPETNAGGHEINLSGVFIHILSDLSHHVSFSMAAFLWHTYEWILAFSIIPLPISVGMLWITIPLFVRAAKVLLQTTPSSIQRNIEKCVKQISYYDGVLECKNPHWWSQSPGVTVGTLEVRVRADANEQNILLFVNSVLRKYITHLTVQIEKDRWLLPSSSGSDTTCI
eukprot:TRINITY_DN8776_c0_g1_i1.p1 TRINITY_DN8776_c0_g1~~TRINITY_DN8776_c0_g1_i1.p1  ORF type:complete len:314 (-),score=41.95 TRINITY_DN8776_c0_g1_i1:150-1091(-)